jgi:hypothetical protein
MYTHAPRRTIASARMRGRSFVRARRAESRRRIGTHFVVARAAIDGENDNRPVHRVQAGGDTPSNHRRNLVGEWTP